MSIEDWMPALADTFGQITGMEQVHTFENLPAVLTVFPCTVIVPVRGWMNYSAGGPNLGLHRVQATVYVAAQVLPEAYSEAVPFIGRVTRKLAATMTLGGRVVHALPDPDGPFYQGPGGIDYGTDAQGAPRKHLGIIFLLEVKERETYTVSA